MAQAGALAEENKVASRQCGNRLVLEDLTGHPGRATYEWHREAENRTPACRSRKNLLLIDQTGTGAPWEESMVTQRLSKKESALSTRRSKRRANNDQKLKYEGKYSTLPDPVERTKSGVVQHALVEPGEQIDQKKARHQLQPAAPRQD
jgi:hypothetical protein